ncbi:MAG: carotenoid 1,2-hydratase [Chromatiales bacterium]|nr:MAG: carotenoid 1,2-hydratase [Chromatiales bacterium]
MRRTLLAMAVVFAALAAGVFWLRGGHEAAPPADTATVVSLLGSGDDDGFRRAARPGDIRLPRDHGSHDDYRSEWWYFTGNLTSADAREFGFQLTFFRFALAPPQPRESGWATNQVYMAHFAVADRTADDHRVAERFARGAAGLAGITGKPFNVWLDDWSAASTTAEFLPLQLSARDTATGIALSLRLQPGKPPVLQGDRGLSAKGAEPGNASWYYSYTRLPAAGVVAVDGVNFEVTGLAWLDREWSTSSLAADVVGWDWFGLQLEDGRDLMLYALRHRDGSLAPQSAGSLVGTDGSRRAIWRDDFSVAPTKAWRSPATGVSWPTEWRVRVPDHGLELDVRAALDDQEQDVAVRYWEGAVDIFPAGGGARLGRGYMELTGYRRPPANRPR